MNEQKPLHDNKSIHPRSILFSPYSISVMIGLAMPEEQVVTNRLKQLALASWALIAFSWYFHEFLPAFAPILHGIVRRVWH